MTRHPTVIAEDEPLARDSLAEWVQALPQLELVDSCADGASALQSIRRHEPALVLMDIQMPGLTGLEVMRALAADPPRRRPAVIFTTAYDEHALTAFELHAVDYLLKPFAPERLAEAVQHALELAEPAPTAVDALEQAQRLPHAAAEPLTRVLVREHGRIVPLQVPDIEHLRSDTKYTAITSRGRSFLVRLPLTAFEQRLDPARFLKVNRSCIVNLDFVEAMTPDDNSQFVVQLRDGTRVTASREVSRQLRNEAL